MLSAIDKLKKSLGNTKNKFLGKLITLVSRRNIDDELLDDIEELLIEADVGVPATLRLIERLKQAAREQTLSKADDIISHLQHEIAAILKQNSQSAVPEGEKPTVWLITGVNGVGKTTTIGKLATFLSARGKRVLIGACDTFRAAAIDQVAIWAERSNVDIIRTEDGADPAAVAFDAARAARAKGIDILLIDTAGRLHTKSHLMEELKKIKRVVQKAVPDSTILSKLILDGTTGQNALSQVRAFTEAVGCDGIIVTKLDGTAKGGVIVALAEEISAPVEYIGIGEGIEDLQAFDAQRFAEAIFS